MNRNRNKFGEVSEKCIASQLRARLVDYEGLDISGCLKLTKQLDRRFCQLFFYQTSKHSKGADIVVKVPIGRGDVKFWETARGGKDRPRLFGRANPTQKPLHEFEALRRIQTHFGSQCDARFDIVRVFDFFPMQNALVMGWNPHPSFRQHLYKAHRLAGFAAPTNLEQIFEHLGAWLQQHHQLPRLSHCETRNSSREDYLLAIERFVTYLRDNTDSPEYFSKVGKTIVALAEEHLPTQIDTGQVHGDFAPRNAFISPTNAVSVFDTLGRFDAPIFEDIAKMLMTVKASGLQLVSFGMLFDENSLRRYEKRLLEGYFQNQTIPYALVKLFEAQLLLEHWAAVVYRYRQAHGLRGWVKGVRSYVWSSGFRSYLNHLVTDCIELDRHRREVVG